MNRAKTTTDGPGQNGAIPCPVESYLTDEEDQMSWQELNY